MFEVITKYRFLDPSQVLPNAGISRGASVADLGCGNGYYPVALAKIVGDTGQVFAVDVQDQALEATVSMAKHEGIKNIYTIRHNLEMPGLKIPENSCDAVVLASTLHLSKLQKNVLREAYRIMKTGARLIVIEWKKEHTLFGPPLNDRISETDMNQLLTQHGFKFQSEMQHDHYHYALIYVK